MSLDPLLPIAPARVKALLLPLGKIKAARFASFAERLQAEHVVQLRDISADGRPNRSKYMHVHGWPQRGGGGLWGRWDGEKHVQGHAV